MSGASIIDLQYTMQISHWIQNITMLLITANCLDDDSYSSNTGKA